MDAIPAIGRFNSDAPKFGPQVLFWLGLCTRAHLPERHFRQVAKMVHQPSQLQAIHLLLGILEKGGIGVMIGPSGVGKTQMAVALAVRHIIDSKAAPRRSAADGPRYATAAEMFRELRSAFGTGAHQSEASMLARFTRPPLLIIDEVHEIKSSDYELRRLTEIIDVRYRKMVPTILISNLGRAELSQQLGPSVISRIFECGQLVDFTNCPSHRGEQVAAYVV